MGIYVALLQGVNIGPKKRIRMEDLRSRIADLGGTAVRTYVNSGNAIFAHAEADAAEVERQLEAALLDHVGMEVATIVRTADEMQQIVKDNPFPEAVGDPKTLHVLFLRDAPAIADVNATEEIEAGPDRFAIHRREVYLFLPNLMSGATIDIARIGKLLRVDGTSRNWNTVTKLRDIARETTSSS